MPSLAQTRLGELSRWFDRNSRWGTTPNGGTLIVGRYASIVPWAFNTLPFTAFDIQSMIFFVSVDECDGIALSDYDPAEPIETHTDIADRMEHVLWLSEDAKLPPCIIVGLDDALEPIAAAVERARLATVDLSAFPVLATPLWTLSDGARYRLRHRLPFVPMKSAVDPVMPSDHVFEFQNRRDRW